MNSPFYTNQIEFCHECVTPGTSYYGHVDCPCCENPVLLGIQIRYCGPQQEVAVKIAEYTGTKLKALTSQMVNAVDTIESQMLRPGQKYNKSTCNDCGGTVEENATCLDGGCLSVSTGRDGDDERDVCWTTTNNPNQSTRTYDCIKGSCMEIGNGRFTSMSNCMKECNDIIDGRSSRTIRGDKTRILPPAPVNEEQSSVTRRTSVTVSEPSFYTCQSTVNPVVSENQHACIPVSTLSNGAYHNLEDCLNSGCGGWIVATTEDRIEANGIVVRPKEIAPIGMCCESYISKSTAPLTIESCTNYCCNGNDVWYPLYNTNGVTNSISSPLSYVNSVISHLITSQIAEVTNNKAPYIRKGYKTIRPYTPDTVNRCSGEVIGYIDHIPVYSSIADAVAQAPNYGCEGYHDHTINGKVGYMPCTSRSLMTIGDDPGWMGDYHGPTNQLTIKHIDGGAGPIHRCCPVPNQPGAPSWVSVNPCGGNNIYTGAVVLGSGCGINPNAAGGGSDPLWCCTYDLLVGPSDIELKEKIEKVGKSESGINIYEFDYKNKSYGEGRYRGVMAQEVPEASFRHEDGYLHVNYSQIDVDFKKVR